MKLLLKLFLVALATFTVLVGLRALGQMIHPGATHYWVGQPATTGGDTGPTNFLIASEDFETNSLGPIYSADLTNGTGWLAAGVLTVYTSYPPANLLVQYNFDEGSGTNLSDSSSNGYSGYLSGASWVTGKSGVGYALQFDGNDDYARTSNNIAFNTNTITVCGWFTWNAFANDDKLLWELGADFDNNSHNFQCDPGSSGGNISFGIHTKIGGNHYSLYRTTPRWATNVWVHLGVM